MEGIRRPREGAAPALRFKAPQPVYGYQPNVATRAQTQSSHAPPPQMAHPQHPQSARLPQDIPLHHHIPPQPQPNIPLQRDPPPVQKDFVPPPQHVPHHRQNFVTPPQNHTPHPPHAQQNFTPQPHNLAQPPYNFAQQPQNTPPQYIHPHTQPYYTPPPQLSSATYSPWNPAFPYGQIPTNFDINALLQDIFSTYLHGKHTRSVPRSVAPFAASAPRPRSMYRNAWLVSCSMHSHHERL